MVRTETADKTPRAERILEAAEALLAEVGYEAASVGAIAARAEVNKALVFYYFDSKEALMERVLERYYRAHLDALAEARLAAEGEDARARIHRLVDAYLDFMAANHRYPRMVLQLLAGSSLPPALVQRHLAPLFDWVTKALAEVAPGAGPLAARHFYVSFANLVTGYFTYAPVLDSLWGEGLLSPAALAERRAHVRWMVDAVLDRLAADTPAPVLASPVDGTAARDRRGRRAQAGARGRAGGARRGRGLR